MLFLDAKLTIIKKKIIFKQLFPWEEPATEIFERTWVIAEEDFVMI